ncbi:ABC transporter permease [Natronogracilivirga saccharolytica]|uniref:Iron ABC transporter permease n=1 Tax=Natronogracilivirga saccharolytica TaxID=2812953 RepID=A0A8J7RJC2_9BACT|nr:iron ABC transporter permease [Natronogracilivirga saccharolytica]MBP3191238.1 iron ABC transporter permease [Natronogracilivirga saccharolytica]
MFRKLKEIFRITNLPSWYFLAPAVLVGILVLIPLIYLVIRALEADTQLSMELVLRTRNLELLYNTLLLAFGTLIVGTTIALPLAWITTRTDIPGRKLLTLLGVLPLAIPGYVMAYALLGFTGSDGTLAVLFGIELPRLRGFPGALTAISLYTFPYLYLNFRAALAGIDPSLEEASRSLGYRPREVFFLVILPQLKPAYYAGTLIIFLYVLGDFGAVSLMRFETFSFAIYLQYAAAYDRVYAAWLALMLLVLTSTALIVEYKLLRGMLFHRTGTGNEKNAKIMTLGIWKWPAYLFVTVLVLLSIVLPVSTILFWMLEAFDTGQLAGLKRALTGSAMASAPAALLATGLAIPLAYIGVRHPSRLTRGLERIAYLGYATPPLAFALALIFFTLSVAPFFYQTLIVLIVAYALHFLAEAIGPVRSSLYQASPRLEEAARSLGYGRLKAFFLATFPVMRNGLIVSAAFVFMSAMKELPITFLLAPVGFETLAVNVWSYTSEAMFAQAAPYALFILVFSALFVGLLFAKEWTKKP